MFKNNELTDDPGGREGDEQGYNQQFEHGVEPHRGDVLILGFLSVTRTWFRTRSSTINGQWKMKLKIEQIMDQAVEIVALTIHFFSTYHHALVYQISPLFCLSVLWSSIPQWDPLVGF